MSLLKSLLPKEKKKHESLQYELKENSGKLELSLSVKVSTVKAMLLVNSLGGQTAHRSTSLWRLFRLELW